ncbi:MAG: SDR family NAD(P)-dependent oxidoreductase [Dehalococcoidia bacterium]
MSLDGKVAVIVGGSRGIGRDVAVALAEAGADVVIAARTEQVTDPRLPGTIYSVAKEVEERGRKALPIKVDVTKDEELEAMAKQTMDTFGRLDILFNNAAILVPGTIRTVQPRHLDLMWRVDLRGLLMAIRYVIDPMAQSGGGHIINVSSRAGVFPGPGPYNEEQRARRGGAFYGMVKAGLERFSQSLAMEVQDENISVNVLSPQGRIKTPGNVFAQNDKENPDLEFEEAVAMGKATVWICEQNPQKYTGNILFDEELCREKGL